MAAKLLKRVIVCWGGLNVNEIVRANARRRNVRLFSLWHVREITSAKPPRFRVRLWWRARKMQSAPPLRRHAENQGYGD